MLFRSMFCAPLTLPTTSHCALLARCSALHASSPCHPRTVAGHVRSPARRHRTHPFHPPRHRHYSMVYESDCEYSIVKRAGEKRSRSEECGVRTDLGTSNEERSGKQAPRQLRGGGKGFDEHFVDYRCIDSSDRILKQSLDESVGLSRFWVIRRNVLQLPFSVQALQSRLTVFRHLNRRTNNSERVSEHTRHSSVPLSPSSVPVQSLFSPSSASLQSPFSEGYYILEDSAIFAFMKCDHLLDVSEIFNLYAWVRVVAT
jgi:hypothetical protein